MSEPSLALQQAVVAALKANAALVALVAGRIYDTPPAAPAFPYVTLGEDQILPAGGDDYDGADVTLTLHAWSAATGFPEVKRIAGAIRAALGPELAVGSGWRLVDLDLESARYLREPDGQTSHAVVTFTALAEPA